MLSHLDTGGHGDVQVTENMLAVLVLGGFAEKRQQCGGFFTAVSHLQRTGTHTLDRSASRVVRSQKIAQGRKAAP